MTYVWHTKRKLTYNDYADFLLCIIGLLFLLYGDYAIFLLCVMYVLLHTYNEDNVNALFLIATKKKDKQSYWLTGVEPELSHTTVALRTALLHISYSV